MHFWQLFHPLRVLSSSVPLVGLSSRLSRLPRSRSNPFVSLTPIPEQSSSDTDLLLHCVSELSAERWLSGMGSMAMLEPGSARRYIEESQTKIPRGGRRRATIRMKNWCYRTWKFIPGLSTAESAGGSRDLCDRVAARRVKCSEMHCGEATKEYCGCLKGYTLIRSQWRHEKH